MKRILLCLAAALLVLPSFGEDNISFIVPSFGGGAGVVEKPATLVNLAKGRIAYQSSAYDHNLTSQLLTDGIISHGDPAYLEVSTPHGLLGKRERESSIDGNEWTRVEVIPPLTPPKQEKAFLQYDWHGMAIMADEVQLFSNVICHPSSNPPMVKPQGGYMLRLLISKDGKSWRKAGMVKGDTLPSGNLTHTFKFKNKKPFSHLRLELEMEGLAQWTVTEVKFRHAGQPIVNEVLPSSHFHSAWMSEGTGQEWVYVDLGARYFVDHVNLHWIWKPKTFKIEYSDDARAWRDNKLDSCRYVRVLMDGGGSRRIALSELEVWGFQGNHPSNSQPSTANCQPQTSNLHSAWRLQRSSEVPVDGALVSSVGFDDSAWTPATVPAIVLMSYVEAGALPDPNYDDNLSLVSESFFNSNFWYRQSFRLPEEMQD